jgi:hypothetical protein
MISVLKRVVAYAATLLFSFSLLIADLAVIAKAQGKTIDLATVARASNSSASQIEPKSAELSNSTLILFRAPRRLILSSVL